jgi:hypothetical protein
MARMYTVLSSKFCASADSRIHREDCGRRLAHAVICGHPSSSVLLTRYYAAEVVCNLTVCAYECLAEGRS